MKRSPIIMTVQRLMRLKTNTLAPRRILSSSYPAHHVHVQSRQGSFGGSRANAPTTIPISGEPASSYPIRRLSSTSTPLIKMMTDAIEMQRNKTQKLLTAESFSSNDWDAVESLLFWWASQETTEGVDWSWKILDRLVVECSRNSMNEKDMEIQEDKDDCLAQPDRQFVAFVVIRLAIRHNNDKRTSCTDCRAGIEQDRQLRPSYCTGCSNVQHDYRCNDYAGPFQSCSVCRANVGTNASTVEFESPSETRFGDV